MKDPYETLGVEHSASPDAIQKAYRRLAKKLHPDLNPGNKVSEESFKEISVAYGLLSDADKRARYDRGEIDAMGAEKPRQRFYKDFASESKGRTTRTKTIPGSRTLPIRTTSCPSCSSVAQKLICTRTDLTCTTTSRSNSSKLSRVNPSG